MKESKTDDTLAFTARVIYSGLNTNDVANMEILGRKLCPIFEAQITKRIIMYLEHIPVYIIVDGAPKKQVCFSICFTCSEIRCYL